MKKKSFNIIIAGVGGQGIITLLRILAEAALIEGREVRTSELHGLSQRGGSVRAHLRIGFKSPLRSGKEIYSPLISSGQADMVLALEICEGLRASSFINKGTIFLVNKKFIPYSNGLSEKEILRKFKKISGKVYFVEASKFCREAFGQEILAGIFLIGFAATRKLIPLQIESIQEAVKRVINKKYLRLNLKTLELAKSTTEKF